MATWKISRRSVRCDACEREFEPEEEHFSWLVFGEDEWRRVDRCLACFQKEPPGPETPYWRTRRPANKRERQVDLESLKAMLEHVVKLELDQRQAQLVFLIALILIRKRRFVLIGTQRSESGDELILGYPKSDRRLRVRAEAPGRAELPELRKALQDLFEDPESSEGLLPAEVLEGLSDPGPTQAGNEGEEAAVGDES